MHSFVPLRPVATHSPDENFAWGAAREPNRRTRRTTRSTGSETLIERAAAPRFRASRRVAAVRVRSTFRRRGFRRTGLARRRFGSGWDPRVGDPRPIRCRGRGSRRPVRQRHTAETHGYEVYIEVCTDARQRGEAPRCERDEHIGKRVAQKVAWRSTRANSPCTARDMTFVRIAAGVGQPSAWETT